MVAFAFLVGHILKTRTLFRTLANMLIIAQLSWIEMPIFLYVFQDSYYKFYPGLIPAYHQICYMYCDIEEDKIQKLIHVNDGEVTIATIYLRHQPHSVLDFGYYYRDKEYVGEKGIN